MNTTTRRTFPALTGETVTAAHVAYCAEHGHATHTVAGIDSGVCPTCGDVAVPSATTAATHPAHDGDDTRLAPALLAAAVSPAQLEAISAAHALTDTYGRNNREAFEAFAFEAVAETLLTGYTMRADLAESDEGRAIRAALASIVVRGMPASDLGSRAHAARSVIHAATGAALRGYSLTATAARTYLEETLLADADLEQSVKLESGARVVGRIIVREEYDEVVDHGTPWPETMTIAPQVAEIVLSSDGKHVGVALEATSIRRESGAQYGGVSVAWTVDETPRPATRHLTTYDYVIAREIVATGTAFGFDAILGGDVEVRTARYSYRGASPRSQASRFEIIGD